MRERERERLSYDNQDSIIDLPFGISHLSKASLFFQSKIFMFKSRIPWERVTDWTGARLNGVERGNPVMP